jgi:hypothetical protein
LHIRGMALIPISHPRHILYPHSPQVIPEKHPLMHTWEYS